MIPFPSLPELVKDKVNGLIFSSSDQLASQLESLLTNFPTTPKLDQMRKTLMRRTTGVVSKGEWCSWDENWDLVVRPLVLTDVDGEDMEWVHEHHEEHHEEHHDSE